MIGLPKKASGSVRESSCETALHSQTHHGVKDERA